MKHIYIIVSKTGSILSRIISRITGDKYTHASIALDKKLDTMYSFGRIFPNNPIIGGFVKESSSYGTMKKFRMANITVIQLKVDDVKFHEMNDYINSMYESRKKYHYNYLGLFLAIFGVHFRRENHFFCSEFVKDILERFNLVDKGKFSNVVRPADLLDIEGEVVYKGKLCEYSCPVS